VTKSLPKTILVTLAAISFLTGCGESTQAPAAPPAPPAISLLEAALKSNLEAVKGHIAAGTDLDMKDPNPQGAQDTALGTAAAFGHLEVVKALIDAGANLEVRNRNGSTPLHLATFLCYPEIVQALVDAGADRTVKDNSGSTALDSVLLPWEAAKGIYGFLDGLIFKPLGAPLDYDRIQAARPQVAQILQ